MKILTLFALALFSVVAAASDAQYPARPVRFIGGTAPGGTTDTIARIVAQGLAANWGQNVVVDNRPGAGSTLGADMVAKAQPDGYTIFVGGFGPNVMAGSLYAKLPYSPANDFVHVTLMVTFPNVLVVPASSPATGIRELIEQARAKPGALTYGSSGVGGSTHVFLELINMRARINTVHVPYKGGAPAITGMLAGEVDYAAPGISTALGLLAAGRIRALAVTSAGANPRLPGVPPLASVLPGYDALEFHGLHAPANTPRHIVVKLQQEVARALRRPEAKERLEAVAMDVVAGTPAEYDAFIRKQIDTWAAVAKSANVRAD